jgi:hypothetical protein
VVGQQVRRARAKPVAIGARARASVQILAVPVKVSSSGTADSSCGIAFATNVYISTVPTTTPSTFRLVPMTAPQSPIAVDRPLAGASDGCVVGGGFVTTGFSTRPPTQKMKPASPRKMSTQTLIMVAA